MITENSKLLVEFSALSQRLSNAFNITKIKGVSWLKKKRAAQDTYMNKSRNQGQQQWIG